MGAVFVLTWFSLVRITIRHLVAVEKSLERNSGVGGSNIDPQIALYSPPVLGLLSWLKAQESLQILEGSNLLPALQLCESHSHIAHIKVCSNLVVLNRARATARGKLDSNRRQGEGLRCERQRIVCELSVCFPQFEEF